MSTSLNIIERIFSNWTALRMVVEHGNGSIDDVHSFCEYIDKTLSINEKLHYTDISGVLEDIMDEEFNTRLEDDSEKQVAQDIVRFHNYITANDIATLTNELQRLPPLQPWIISNQNLKLPRADQTNDDDSDSDDVDESEQDKEAHDSGAGKSNDSMEVDSEGWSVIRRKKK